MVGRSLTDLLARGIDNRSRACKITPERELIFRPSHQRFKRGLMNSLPL